MAHSLSGKMLEIVTTFGVAPRRFILFGMVTFTVVVHLSWHIRTLLRRLPAAPTLQALISSISPALLVFLRAPPQPLPRPQTSLPPRLPPLLPPLPLPELAPEVSLDESPEGTSTTMAVAWFDCFSYQERREILDRVDARMNQVAANAMEDIYWAEYGLRTEYELVFTDGSVEILPLWHISKLWRHEQVKILMEELWIEEKEYEREKEDERDKEDKQEKEDEREKADEEDSLIHQTGQMARADGGEIFQR